MIRKAVVGLLAMGPAFLVPAPTFADAPGSSKQICNPIGRITQGSSANFRSGQVVCEGQEVRQPTGVQFLCFTNSSLVSLTGPSAVISEATCRESRTASNPRVRSCNHQGISRLLCLVPKGPDEQFQLIEPDEVSMNPRPPISWEEVAGAESYTVRVIGPNISWERTVEAAVTEIVYPLDEPPMTEGNAYEVIVVANRIEESITASKVVNVQDSASITLRLKQTEPSKKGG